MNLRIPGPTPCPEDVLQAVASPMINHRGPEFRDLLYRVTQKLQRVFETRNDIIILTCAGTGGMEAAVVNTLSPGDRVLAVSIGVFGDRFAQIAQAYGAEVKKLDFPWGKAADPDKVRQALREDPGIKAVLITHNETSTGVTNDLEALARVVKEFDKLLLVDAVSSLGAIPLPVDRWRCDVVITGSQKGWMVPPGLAMLSFGEAAWQAHARARMPRFYFDLTKAKQYYQRGETPWTPAISIFFGLDRALDRMLQEGLPQIFARHAHIARMVREGAKELGLSLFAEEAVASNTVTALHVPEGVDGKKLLQVLREEYGVVLAGGQQRLEGKVFRIGHLGYVTEKDIEDLLHALKQVLPRVGFAGTRGPGHGSGPTNPK